MAAAQPLSPPAWRDCPCSPALAEQPSTSSQGFAAAQAAPEAPAQQPEHRRQTLPPAPQPPQYGVGGLGLAVYTSSASASFERSTEH